MWGKRGFLASALLGAAGLIGPGGGSAPCESGEARDCQCDDGSFGQQACEDDGSAWGECECDGDGAAGTTGSGGRGSGGSGPEGSGGDAGGSGPAGSGGAAGSGTVGGAAGTAETAGGAAGLESVSGGEGGGTAGTTGGGAGGGAGEGGAMAGSAGEPAELAGAGGGSAGASAGAGGVEDVGGAAGAAGISGSPGSGGDAGGPTLAPEGPSCVGMSGTECNGESCCTTIVVPGGTFPMGRGTETCSGCADGCPAGMTCGADEQPEHSAVVSSFALDKYEVTVARFRAFVEAGGGTQGSPPWVGTGAHPLIAGSGWDSAWNADLAADQATLVSRLTCGTGSGSATWTSSPGANESCPMSCINWYEAFAFCIWDDGRLPTEAEWEYAAAGGDENRVYPWGNTVVEPLPANYNLIQSNSFFAVGSYADGNGRWGHADLAGSMSEWVFDWYASDWYTTSQTGCVDCANLTPVTTHPSRGGDWAANASAIRVTGRPGGNPTARGLGMGFRCARDAP